MILGFVGDWNYCSMLILLCSTNPVYVDLSFVFNQTRNKGYARDIINVSDIETGQDVKALLYRVIYILG